MWFLGGTLALIVLDVLLQPGSADKVTSASGIAVTALNRFLSPDVALIPDHSSGSSSTKTASTSTGKTPTQQIPNASNPAPIITT